jgi:hypothetical protein
MHSTGKPPLVLASWVGHGLRPPSLNHIGNFGSAPFRDASFTPIPPISCCIPPSAPGLLRHTETGHGTSPLVNFGCIIAKGPTFVLSFGFLVVGHDSPMPASALSPLSPHTCLRTLSSPLSPDTLKIATRLPALLLFPLSLHRSLLPIMRYPWNPSLTLCRLLING